MVKATERGSSMRAVRQASGTIAHEEELRTSATTLMSGDNMICSHATRAPQWVTDRLSVTLGGLAADAAIQV